MSEDEEMREAWTWGTLKLQDLLAADNEDSRGEIGRRLERMNEIDGSNAVRMYMTGLLTGIELCNDLLVSIDQDEVTVMMQRVIDRLQADMASGICLGCITGSCSTKKTEDDESVN